MTMSQILVPAIIVCVIGALAFIVGLRGRRLNRDVVCRKCRYNLSGSSGVPEVCPECGRDLAGRRAVRHGERRRLRSLVVISVLMLIVGSGGIGVHVFFAHVQGQPAEFKPEWWLLMDIDSTSPARIEDGFTELHRRIGVKSLSEGGRAALYERVHGWFADLSRPWDARWMDVIDDASSPSS